MKGLPTIGALRTAKGSSRARICPPPRAGDRGPRPRGAQHRGGYILVETMVALVLLALGSWAIHGTIRQAILARGQAQDYTQARFLLEEVVAKLEMQPLLQLRSSKGSFPGELNRFSWEYVVRMVNVPRPAAPPAGGQSQRGNQSFEYPVEYLAHVHATVSWTRAGREFSESFETLFRPDKLWVPD